MPVQRRNQRMRIVDLMFGTGVFQEFPIFIAAHARLAVEYAEAQIEGWHGAAGRQVAGGSTRFGQDMVARVQKPGDGHIQLDLAQAEKAQRGIRHQPLAAPP